MKKIVASCAMVGMLMLTATACRGDDSRGKGDAPAGKGDDSKANITNMPDGFSNLAVKCLKGDAPWAMGVTTSSDFALFQDPTRCGGKAVLGPLVVTSAQ
jgi:hypothetical protein